MYIIFIRVESNYLIHHVDYIGRHDSSLRVSGRGIVMFCITIEQMIIVHLVSFIKKAWHLSQVPYKPYDSLVSIILLYYIF